jgi:hypothetical protein
MSEFAQNFRVSGYLSKNVDTLPSELTTVCITYLSQNGLWSSRLIKSVGIYRLQCHSACILILSSHPRLGIPSGSFLTGFRTVSIFHFSHTCNFPRVSHPSFERPSVILRRVQSMNLLSSRKYLHLAVPLSHLGTNILFFYRIHSVLEGNNISFINYRQVTTFLTKVRC